MISAGKEFEHRTSSRNCHCSAAWIQFVHRWRELPCHIDKFISHASLDVLVSPPFPLMRLCATQLERGDVILLHQLKKLGEYSRAVHTKRIFKPSLLCKPLRTPLLSFVGLLLLSAYEFFRCSPIGCDLDPCTIFEATHADPPPWYDKICEDQFISLIARSRLMTRPVHL